MTFENSQDLDILLKNVAQRVSSNLLFRSGDIGIEEIISIHVIFRKHSKVKINSNDNHLFQ